MSHSEMPYRSLGRCGTRVSVFALGGWLTFGKQITDNDTARGLITSAFDAGINFFDIADVYANGRSEEVMGAVFRDFPRHELLISSKVFFPMSDAVNDRGLSRKHIMASIERSLRRIGTDHLDLYFCHRYDEHTPLEETVRAMDDLVHQGKVLYWGTSEWSGRQLTEVQTRCHRGGWYAPQVEQPQYSLLERSRFESNVRPAVEAAGMGVVCWSPLAMGILTGKYDGGMNRGSRMDREEWLREGRFNEANLKRVREFKDHADRLGCSRAQLALAWVAAQPQVSSVILGATRLEQLQENLGALKVAVSGDLDQALRRLFPEVPHSPA